MQMKYIRLFRIKYLYQLSLPYNPSFRNTILKVYSSPIISHNHVPISYYYPTHGFLPEYTRLGPMLVAVPKSRIPIN